MPERFVNRFFDNIFKNERYMPKKQMKGKISWLGSDLTDLLIEEGKELEIIEVKRNGRIYLKRAFDILK